MHKRPVFNKYNFTVYHYHTNIPPTIMHTFSTTLTTNLVKSLPALLILVGLPDIAMWSMDHYVMEQQQCFMIVQLYTQVQVYA